MIAETHRGHIASPETCHKMSDIHKKRQQDLVLRQRTSATLKEYFKNPDVRQRKAKASRGRRQSADERDKKAEAMKLAWRQPEIRNRISSASKEAIDRPEVKERRRVGIHRRWENPSERQRQSLLSKELWQDPEYVRKVLAGIGRKPTKPELILDSILNNHFPEFKYNGDYSLGIMITGQIPDFVNVNGKKEIIEVFGDYHHSPQFVADKWQRTELGKVMLYNSVGWKCLVIWEHEIKALKAEELLCKIETFLGRGSYGTG